ncbi:LacI family transcriptional regulator, partial [Bacillus stratosphericus]
GQYGLVKQIIASGHRRIAYLSLQPQVIASKLRRAGYRRALEEAGIAYDAALDLAGYPDYTNRSESLLAAVEKLLRLPDPPTVLCCGNDEMAVRLYGILRSRGIKVPEEMSVAGYDDHRSIAETLFPPLTTADLPYTAMGERAAQMLLDAVAGKALPPQPVVVGAGTVWRQSVIKPWAGRVG